MADKGFNSLDTNSIFSPLFYVIYSKFNKSIFDHRNTKKVVNNCFDWAVFSFPVPNQPKPAQTSPNQPKSQILFPDIYIYIMTLVTGRHLPYAKILRIIHQREYLDAIYVNKLQHPPVKFIF